MILKNKINKVLVLIFFCFCASIFSIKHNLTNFDKLKPLLPCSGFSDSPGWECATNYHVMIKNDLHRYHSHGYEIKKDLINGKNYLETGRQNFTKYLPPRIIAAYYYLFNYDLFEASTKKEIKLGIHSKYLFIQCLIYFLSLFYFYNILKKKTSKRVCFFTLIFLGLEPTIFQYHATFWTESIFFSLQILLVGLILNNKNNYINFLTIGFFLGITALHRTHALIYIIPVIIYFLFILEKKNYYKILFTVFSFSLVMSFVGYHNYVRAGNFYIVPNEVKTVFHTYVAPQIIDKKEFNDQKEEALRWMKNNNINIDIKKLRKYEYNRFAFVLCESPFLKNEKDKIKVCNYLNDQAIKMLIENPFLTFKYVLKKSVTFPLLNPFHIYSDHRFPSGESYYKSDTWYKVLPYRIIYSLIIYSIVLLGLFKMFRERNILENNKILLITIFSIIFFFSTASWHGNTRYFVPIMIYLSLFFGSGSVLIIDFLKNKKLII